MQPRFLATPFPCIRSKLQCIALLRCCSLLWISTLYPLPQAARKARTLPALHRAHQASLVSANQIELDQALSGWVSDLQTRSLTVTVDEVL